MEEPLEETRPFEVNITSWDEWTTFESPDKKPPRLFKYHSLNNHLLGLIGTRSLWFSEQSELNDPFEFRYSLDPEFSDSILNPAINQITKDIREGAPDLICNDDSHFKKELIKLIGEPRYQAKMYKMIHEELFEWAVCCFSTRRDNELMWAHYADSNRGVCLEFDLSQDPSLHNKLMPVLYDDQFPRIKDISDVPKALFKKRRAWSHEAEWRILKMGKGPMSFDRSCLKAIHFGCNASRNGIRSVRRVLQEAGYSEVRLTQLNLRIDGVNVTNVSESE